MLKLISHKLENLVGAHANVSAHTDQPFSLNIFISFYKHTCTTWSIVQYNRIGTKAMALIWFLHYENMSVQYSAISNSGKNDFFLYDFFYIFLILAQNIDCGYTLEPPQQGGSNEYPQSMFWSTNKKNMYTRVNPTFFYIKVGCKG